MRRWGGRHRRRGAGSRRRRLRGRRRSRRCDGRRRRARRRDGDIGRSRSAAPSQEDILAGRVHDDVEVLRRNVLEASIRSGDLRIGGRRVATGERFLGDGKRIGIEDVQIAPAGPHDQLLALAVVDQAGCRHLGRREIAGQRHDRERRSGPADVDHPGVRGTSITAHDEELPLCLMERHHLRRVPVGLHPVCGLQRPRIVRRAIEIRAAAEWEPNPVERRVPRRNRSGYVLTRRV